MYRGWFLSHTGFDSVEILICFCFLPEGMWKKAQKWGRKVIHHLFLCNTAHFYLLKIWPIILGSLCTSQLSVSVVILFFFPSKIAVLCSCLPKAWLINNSATLYNHSKWNLYTLIYFGEYVKEGFFIMLSLHVIIVIAVALYLFHLSKKILE